MCRRLRVSESDAVDLLVRAAHNGRVAEHSGLHLAVRGEDTGEVQCASHVPHETEAARHPGGREGLRMGGFPGQGGDGSADSLHVQKLSCECATSVIEDRSAVQPSVAYDTLIANVSFFSSLLPV